MNTQVQAEIQGLMKTSSPYLLATRDAHSLHRLLALHRYLLPSTSFLVDKNSCSIIPVILSGATHSVDCLDAVAAAFTPSLSQANVPCFLTPSRPQEMSLYREWRGLSPDCDAQG